MESENHPAEFLILDSSPQLGDGLDYDRKAAQAALEGKPFVLLFGCSGDTSGRSEPLHSFKSRDAIVCHVDIVNCRNRSLRSYMQLIGLDGRGTLDESLNGTAQIFTVTRNRAGGLILHSTGSPTYNVHENCDALNEQLRNIKSALSPGEQDLHIEMTPLPMAEDIQSMTSMPPPEVSFTARGQASAVSMTALALPAPGGTPHVDQQYQLDQYQSSEEFHPDKTENFDPSSEEFRRKIEEYARQWTALHEEALNNGTLSATADQSVTSE